MSKLVNNSVLSGDPPFKVKSDAEKIAHLENELEALKTLVKEKDDTIQRMLLNNVHKEKPRSPMCG